MLSLSMQTALSARRQRDEYEHYKSIYQEAVDFPRDAEGNYYQASVFFAYEACGLGYRRGGKILDNMSKFVGHVIR